MADFTWVESAGTALRPQVTIGETRFGDGYTERGPAGLNPLRQRWSVRFAGIDRDVAQEIMDFLQARVTATAGLEPFDWTPLWSTTPIRVVCQNWERTQADRWDLCDVAAEFEQDFAP